MTSYLRIGSIILGASMILSAHANQAQRAPSFVLSSAIEFAPFTEEVELIGTAEATRSVVLYPAVSERVTRVYHQAGEQVTKGSVLYQLDDRAERAKFQMAKIDLEDARSAFNRLAKSLNDGATTQSIVDSAKFRVSKAEVALLQAKYELQDRQVLAPFDGVLGLTDIEEGDRVTTQTKLATLDFNKALYVEFDVPEHTLPLLNSQETVQLSPWGDDSEQLIADLALVDSRINPSTRTVRVKAQLGNSQLKYMPGSSFRIKIIERSKVYPIIPEAALMWGSSGPFIWLSEQNKAKKVHVKVVQRQRGHILVNANIARDDTLIVEGVQRLRDGQAVSTQLAQVNL